MVYKEEGADRIEIGITHAGGGGRGRKRDTSRKEGLDHLEKEVVQREVSK